MSAGRRRVDTGEYARRVNAAAELLGAGTPVAEAARVLAARFDCSVRQARRYVERAAHDGPSGHAAQLADSTDGLTICVEAT